MARALNEFGVSHVELVRAGRSRYVARDRHPKKSIVTPMAAKINP